MIEKLTDTMVEIEGESMRPVTWVTIEEVDSGDWGIGGKALTTQDVREDLRRAGSRLRPPCDMRRRESSQTAIRARRGSRNRESPRPDRRLRRRAR